MDNAGVAAQLDEIGLLLEMKGENVYRIRAYQRAAETVRSLGEPLATVRERGEVRRLALTLTAQGRMARWILTALPVVLTLLMLLIVPKLMKPLLTSTGGQTALAIAALMVVAGSFWIKRIVEIEV